MRQLILVFVAFFTLNFSFPHDSVSATFNIIERGHVLLLEIDFEEENFIKFGDTQSLKITKKDFSKYLRETTSWEFDGKELTPQILSIKSDHQHTKVICFLSKAIENIKSVKVKNEFLIDVANHSNIIKLDINDSFKDFRMHKERRQLKVEY